MNNKKKLLTSFIILVLTILVINKIDKKIRFDMNLTDYYINNKNLSSEEVNFIREKPIVVGVSEFPPLSYINKYNSYNKGIIIDHLSQIAIETGSDINIMALDSKDLEKSLNSKKVDAIIFEDSASNVMKDVLLTDVISNIMTRVLVKKDLGVNKIKDLEGKVMLVLAKDNLNNEVEKFFKDTLNMEVMEVDNIYEAFALMDKSMAHSFIGRDMEIMHYLHVTNSAGRYKFLDNYFDETKIRIAVNSDNKILLNILNKGILDIKKKNLIAQTQYKWLGKENSDIYDLAIINNIYKITSLILVIVLLFSIWNYIITRKVQLRTRELMQSREELRLIIDTIDMGIMVLNREGVIIECNQGLTDIINIGRNRLINNKYMELDCLKEFLNKKNLNNIYNKENKYFYTTKQRITDDKCLVIIEDYTEKYLIEVKERQQSKMVTMGKLSAGLAHEIRNPLGLIKSYCYILEKTDEAKIKDEAILTINKSVDRINKLIENLLRFSRLSKNKMEYTNVNKLLDSILLDFKTKLSQEKVTLNVGYLNEELSNMKINDEIFRMTIINLLDNSIEAFRDKDIYSRKIKLKLVNRNKYIDIIIEDNAGGMTKEEKINIFEPFYSTKKNGTGLGLYIVATEVFNNGGEIFLESNLNSGTSFKVSLKKTE